MAKLEPALDPRDRSSDATIKEPSTEGWKRVFNEKEEREE
jgi:hypothetical protein